MKRISQTHNRKAGADDSLLRLFIVQQLLFFSSLTENFERGIARLFSIGGKQSNYSSVSGDLTMECKKIAAARRSAQPPALTFRTLYS